MGGAGPLLEVSTMQIEINRSTLSLANEGLVAIRDGQGTRIVCHTGSLWITQECDLKDAVIRAGEFVYRAESRADAAHRAERFRSYHHRAGVSVQIRGGGTGLQERRSANPCAFA